MKAVYLFVVIYMTFQANATTIQRKQGDLELKARPLASNTSEGFFDDFVDGLEDAMIGGGYDNINLPGGGFEFTIKVGFINQKGSVDCTGGSIKGMQTMRRDSEIDITKLPSGQYRVAVTLSIPTASISYSCKATFMGINPSLTASGSVDNVKLNLVLLVDSSGNVQVEEFSQSGSGSSNYNIGGLPDILSPITNQLTNWVGENAARAITQIIQDTIGAFIGPLVAGIIFPVPAP